jgi:HSP20 family protein
MWHPFDALRCEIDRLFDDFDGGSWRSPFRRSMFDMIPFPREALSTTSPAVDVAEKDNEYEITAELPGLDEKDIEVKLSNGGVSIKGRKEEAKEEKKKGYVLSERRYGSFERYFSLPEGIDTDKISANFNKGVLTVTLPKTSDAQKQDKKITVKAA